jgi:hypothetical protein
MPNAGSGNSHAAGASGAFAAAQASEVQVIKGE